MRAKYLLGLKAKNQQARDGDLTDKEIDKELKRLGVVCERTGRQKL